jgi:hypothetical protein
MDIIVESRVAVPSSAARSKRQPSTTLQVPPDPPKKSVHEVAWQVPQLTNRKFSNRLRAQAPITETAPYGASLKVNPETMQSLTS